MSHLQQDLKRAHALFRSGSSRCGPDQQLQSAIKSWGHPKPQCHQLTMLAIAWHAFQLAVNAFMHTNASTKHCPSYSNIGMLISRHHSVAWASCYDRCHICPSPWTAADGGNSWSSAACYVKSLLTWSTNAKATATNGSHAMTSKLNCMSQTMWWTTGKGADASWTATYGSEP